MESLSVGIFLLAFLMVVGMIALPISLLVGSIVYVFRKREQKLERILRAVVISAIAFMLLIISACVVLIIWNPAI